jgi:hypothetical protein
MRKKRNWRNWKTRKRGEKKRNSRTKKTRMPKKRKNEELRKHEADEDYGQQQLVKRANYRMEGKHEKGYTEQK